MATELSSLFFLPNDCFVPSTRAQSTGVQSPCNETALLISLFTPLSLVSHLADLQLAGDSNRRRRVESERLHLSDLHSRRLLSDRSGNDLVGDGGGGATGRDTLSNLPISHIFEIEVLAEIQRLTLHR